MAKYRKKPVTVEATRWFGLGDHYAVGHLPPSPPCSSHGRDEACEHCGSTMRAHGYINTLEGGHIVCPGDWIITGVKGENYSCKPDIFEQTYECMEE